jgi:hypothetical protein
MKREDINRQLQEDLARIPRGDHSQNVLRSIYNMQRRSDLARDARTPKANSLAEAIRFVRKDEASFEATVDSAYFSK